MANYSVQNPGGTAWSGRDALATGHTDKVIKASDLVVEFNEIAARSADKADTASPTFTGTVTASGADEVTAPTVSASDNSTKVATTAYVTTAVAALDKAAINNLVYPVGSIFTTTSDSAASATTPAEVNTLLGMGTWEAFGKGRVLIGNGTSTDDDQPIPESQTFTAGTEGGEFKHTLTVDEMPSHTHKTWAKQESFDPIRTHAKQAYANTSIATNDPPLADTGGDDPHNNLQPYIVVYMWKRTA